jgi:MoxR-like ATPase
LAAKKFSTMINEMHQGNTDIKAINELIQRESAFIDLINMEVNKTIIGQKYMVERLVLALLSQGHILLEGVPGLAKTLSIKSLASSVNAKFSRIQFTPDLLPADLVGTLIYNQKENEFTVKKGPVFANFILADEINRAPAKVQSALLEAMQEKQVTIGEETFKLEEPFLVLATQNPIEQEGTYPLPEAQVDRFMLKVIVTYPKKEEERIYNSGWHFTYFLSPELIKKKVESFSHQELNIEKYQNVEYIQDRINKSENLWHPGTKFLYKPLDSYPKDMLEIFGDFAKKE